MSDFTAVDALILQIANEVVKKGITKTKVANVLTMLRDHISEIELTPGPAGATGATGATGETGAAGPYFAFRVFNDEVIQIRLSSAVDPDPWINLVYLSDLIGPAGPAGADGAVGPAGPAGADGADGSPDTAAQIRDKINSLAGEDRLSVAVLKDFVTQVLAQITEEVADSDIDNFATLSDVTYLQNIYGRKITTSVSFERPCIHAGSFDPTTKKVTAPIYNDLAVSKTVAFHKNEAIVFHTSESVAPPVLAGSLPSWLILTGDSYLVGLGNMNVLSFQYFEKVKVDSTYYEDVVVCNIEAFNGGNTDLNASLLIDLNFNENDSPVTASSVINHSPLFASKYVPEIITPLESSYESLGGTNYGMVSGLNSVSFPTRSEIVINVDPAYISKITTKVTVIARVKAIAFSTESERTIISSFSTNAGGTNVRRGFRITILSTGQIRVRVARADGTNQQDYSADVTKLVVTGNGYYTIATTIDCIGTTPEIKTWWKSVANAIPFENIQNTVGAHALSLESPLDFSLDKIDILTSTSSRATGKDHYYVFERVLTESQIESIVNQLDPTP